VHKAYTATHLLDGDEFKQFLSLQDADGVVREDFAVEHQPQVIAFLQNHFANSDDEPLQVQMTCVTVEPMHRDEGEVTFEKITAIRGADNKIFH
jgi:hypothetical protein